MDEASALIQARNEIDRLQLRFAAKAFRQGYYQVNRSFWPVYEAFESALQKKNVDFYEVKDLKEVAFSIAEEAIDKYGVKYKF